MLLIQLVKCRAVQRQHESTPAGAVLGDDLGSGQVNLVNYLDGSNGRQIQGLDTPEPELDDLDICTLDEIQAAEQVAHGLELCLDIVRFERVMRICEDDF